MRTSDALPDVACQKYLDLTDDVVYSLDCDLNLSYLNGAGHALLSLESEAAYGRPWMAFIHENDRPRVREALREALQGAGAPTECEARLCSLHGSLAPVRHRLRATRDAGGAVVGLLGIGRDVHDLKRLEEQLQQSQKLETIGMLAGGIAHDFNNMLAAVIGYTDLMLDDKTEDDPDYRSLANIRTSADRAAALAKQLLVYSRRTKSELKPTELAGVIDETLQILERTLPRTIRINAHTGEPGDQVLADRNRLQQALMNLCVNARDAMPRGGELRIDVERVRLAGSRVTPAEGPAPLGDASSPREYLHLKVQDTGAGIPPDVLEHIWEPFFTTKPSGEGTGLGLSVVEGIIRAHNGHVRVESQPGRGTAFYVYLPVAAGAEADQGLALSEPPGGEETILVVDDEPVLLSLLDDMLTAKGYKVLAAPGGAEAVEYVQAVGDRIHLVISDSMMPGMTGRQLAQEIMRLKPQMPILVCSGFSPTRESEIGEMDYVASYVQKPYQRRELLTRVREVLDGVPARQPV